ncbi:class I adenylate-forming enzyme family protein [Sphingomonas sp. SUN039]|uniref:class I adenylate-forming enzyme family protein n=1 Tax=Sphingomonas sp. SUN039 TaxID=2937787 RepID=UPI00216415EF|nr:class I adenylate-forming enzyme family protein [Sphingomonas sp. SUN039]UVO52658.1 acyl--CoA ligase [Sphingomonas sp. SUN039]
MSTASTPSIIYGPPLDEEQGIGDLTLGGWLRAATAQGGKREALVLHEDGQAIRWSHAELWDQANAVARALIACGVGKGTRVGVLMTNRPEFLAAAFGTALAGGVATTFSTFSTQAELDYLLQASCVSVLLVERKVLKKDFVEMLAGLGQEDYPYLTYVATVGTPTDDVEGWDSFVARGNAVPQAQVDARAAGVSPADTGVLFFSSGSTAKPKGVLSSHRGVTLQLWRWRRFNKAESDARAWSANGFFWSGNFCMALGGALTAGGSLVLQKTFDPAEALTLMEAERVTMAYAWPHQYAQLEAAPNWLSVDLSALHYVNTTYAFGKHPTVKTDWQEPWHAYGNTETFTINSIFDSGTPVERINNSHGEPLAGNVFKIVDPLTGAVVPMGERGEIAVKGPTLMMGYLGIPLADSLDSEGFFRTGDGGYVDAENRLYWEGRLNDIIKTGGANVSPIEVDELIKTCPGVKVCQTVGVPHDTLGELVVSCIVPHADATLDEAAVQAFAKAQLASFKVPRRVLFFAEDEIALTGTSKIKTADLRALAAKRLDGE